MDAVVELVISKVAKTVEDLLSELRSFRVLYLTKAAENSNDNEALLGDDDVVKKIQRVVTDAEDAIDKYLVERRKHRGRGVLMKWGEKLTRLMMLPWRWRALRKGRRNRVDLELLQGGSLNNHQLPAADLQCQQ